MGNSASALPYDHGAQLEYNGNSHWSLRKGTKKDEKEGDKEEISIFRFLKNQTDKLLAAQKCLQKIRTIKHPFILSYVNSADVDDSIIIVTESCLPLETWIKQQNLNNHSEDEKFSYTQEILWGIKCLLNALAFLHNTCHVSHNYLGMHAVFVCKNGDWKLGALDLAANLKNTDEKQFLLSNLHLLSRTYLAPERQNSMNSKDIDSAQINAQGSADIYSLGQLISTIFSQTIMEMPNDVDKCVQKMIHNDIRRRPTATHALKYPLFNSEHISLLASLGEMAIKSTTEIVDILGNISNQVNTIPKSICLYKLLPSVSRVMQMSVNDFNNRDARESCRQSVNLSLTLLARLADENKLDEAALGNACLSVILKLWSMSDRALRTSLLKTLKSLVPLIPDKDVNHGIFEHMIQGFSDSNAKMREETLKNLVHVVDKLDERHLQETLVRCVSGLQTDGEAGIRTNATIFLGRIASKLKDSVRSRVLCNAFTKAMKDNFVHCRYDNPLLFTEDRNHGPFIHRIAGLKASVACLHMLPPNQIAGKLLPQVCVMVMDRSAEVRELSLNLLESSIVNLRRNHEVLTKQENSERSKQKEKDSVTTSQDTSTASSSWASWAFGITAKSVEQSSFQSFSNETNHSTEVHTSKNDIIRSNDQNVPKVQSSHSFPSDDEPMSPQQQNNHQSMNNDGWGDDDFDVDDDFDDTVKSKNTSTKNLANSSNNSSSTTQIKSNSNEHSKSTSNSNSGWDDFDIDDDDEEDDPFASIPTRVIEEKDSKHIKTFSSSRSARDTISDPPKKKYSTDKIDDNDDDFFAGFDKKEAKVIESKPRSSSIESLKSSNKETKTMPTSSKALVKSSSLPSSRVKDTPSTPTGVQETTAALPMKETTSTSSQVRDSPSTPSGVKETTTTSTSVKITSISPRVKDVTSTSSRIKESTSIQKNTTKKVAVTKLAVDASDNWDDF